MRVLNNIKKLNQKIMTKLTSKFAEQFKNSNKDTFESRGEIIVKQMTNTSNQLILELESKKFNIDIEIAKMMDFGKSHTTQLKVDEPLSYKNHLERLKELKIQAEEINLELTIMTEIHSEWFEDEKDKSKEK